MMWCTTSSWVVAVWWQVPAVTQWLCLNVGGNIFVGFIPGCYCTPHWGCGDAQQTNTTASDKCGQPLCKHLSFFSTPHSVSAEVSAGFKSGMSVSYIFQEEAGNSSSSSVLPSSVHPYTSLRAENISLNFRTSHSPALLLYVSSYRREYLALLLNQHGERQPHEEENQIEALLAFQCGKKKIRHTVHMEVSLNLGLSK